MAVRYSEPHAPLRMHQRGVDQTEVERALWTERERHEAHRHRRGSFWAAIPGRTNLWVLYRRLEGDDFVITVTARSNK